MRRRTAEAPSRVGSFLFVLGVLTVLGTSFVIGVSAGRRWPGLLPALGRIAATTASPGAIAGVESGSRGGGAAGGVRPGRAVGGPGELAGSPPAPAVPVLTFYRELTAPLAPPPAPKPERSERARAGTPAATVARPEPARTLEVRAPAAGELPDRRFTVQVGAFKTREQAEAMQTTLVAAGHDAYVAALDVSSGARFRVRVGTFATRDDARQAVERLTRERQLAAYVTIR